MTARQGPLVTADATCQGCAWLFVSDQATVCNHDNAPRAIPGEGRGIIGRRALPCATTPAWCPLLPAARLALARSIVAEPNAVLEDIVGPVMGVEGARCRGPGTGEDYNIGRVKCMVRMMGARWRATNEADRADAAHGAGESEE